MKIDVYHRILENLGVLSPESNLGPLIHPEPSRSNDIEEERDDPEVLRRVDLFRDHLNKPGYSLFFVIPGAKVEEGICQTCGERPVSGSLRVRCHICNMAARIALEDRIQFE